MTPLDIQDRIALEARAQHKPEAFSVAVVVPDGMTISDAEVRTVAPQIAKALHPTCSFGDVLHVEQIDAQTFHVAVELTHPLSAVTIGRKS